MDRRAPRLVGKLRPAEAAHEQDRDIRANRPQARGKLGTTHARHELIGYHQIETRWPRLAHQDEIEPRQGKGIFLPELIPMHRVVLDGEPPYPSLCQGLVQEQIADLHVPEAPPTRWAASTMAKLLSLLDGDPGDRVHHDARSMTMAPHHRPVGS